MGEFSLVAPSPSWVVSGAAHIEGLDLLGLRVPVISIGRVLLTGVTTISPIVRYVALRAWIARRYALARLPDSQESFRAFAGKIEAAIAVGNLLVDRKAMGLVGRGEAAALVDSRVDPIPLRTLVGQLASSAYAGPSNELGISFAREEVPGLDEERGLLLSSLVDAVLGNTAIGQALAAQPMLATFSREDLKSFGKAFPITIANQEERRALLNCILPANPRETKETREAERVATYGALLELSALAKHPITERDLFEEALSTKPKLPAVYRSCLDGWARYQVRDMIAVVHEAVLAVIANVLKNQGTTGSAPFHELLVGLLAKETALRQPLQGFGLLTTEAKPLEQPLSSLVAAVRAATPPISHNRLPRWEGPLQEFAVIGRALAGDEGCLTLAVIAWLLVQERVGATSRTETEDAKRLSYGGSWRLGVDQVILPGIESMLRRNLTVREAAYELARRTVEQHFNIAWSRLAIDPRKDVSVIVSDGDRWVRQARDKSFSAGRIASRLHEAIGWLGQLGLTDKTGCTEEGHQYIERIRTTLSKTTEAP